MSSAARAARRLRCEGVAIQYVVRVRADRKVQDSVQEVQKGKAQRGRTVYTKMDRGGGGSLEAQGWSGPGKRAGERAGIRRTGREERISTEREGEDL